MTTIKEAIEKGLDNLNDEAYFPLIHFARKLNIEMEKSSRNMIINWAKKFIFLNGDFHLAKKILSSLDKTIEYLQKAIGKHNPTYAKRFFNFVKDKYAKSVVNKFFSVPANKDQFVEKTTEFAKKEMLSKILAQFKKNNITLAQPQFSAIKHRLQNLINEIEDNGKTLANIMTLKAAMAALPKNVQEMVLNKILQRKKLDEDLVATFTQQHPANLVADIQEKVNNNAIHLIKNKQAQEVYKYDGLIERIIPASIRGLYDVDRSVVESIALKGDTSKVEDLFNFEVASNARQNKTYKVGHTGGSNRSSTTLANIAMYFASKHGLKHGKPESTWIMIYESSKGINTTELVDKNVDWTEFEFASTALKPERFLGAVKFEVDDANSDKHNIAFKAVDGFVAPKVHTDNYKKTGVEGDIKHFLELAKHYDKPNLHAKPQTKFKLPRSSKKVSDKRSFFQKIYDFLGLSHNLHAYKKERLQQLDFVQHETDARKAARLAEEKSEMGYWQAFSDQLYQGVSHVKGWLPGFNAMVKKLDPEHKKEVTDALKAELKASHKRKHS
ncbi:MAG: hypothetical protein BGO43_12120 [Gammaproteobacteria bacterium 39-13]|nr:hypothetical protein [Gammaproteobacteria bacterium]OJV86206.1 MAG: hypothetical protein BGO43_12120 [Gammaproteobacteria bacterium 39-13]